MNVIGFSHHYTKIHGQTWGKLLSVEERNFENAPDEIGLGYDSGWNDGGSKGLSPLSREDFNKPMLQLVFIGNHDIPFTTYRISPRDYVPTFAFSPRRTHIPYSDMVEQLFAFKFKGEDLPKELLEKVERSSLKPVWIID